jgi:hypothetical protein
MSGTKCSIWFLTPFNLPFNLLRAALLLDLLAALEPSVAVEGLRWHRRYGLDGHQPAPGHGV